ncbi:hypothetical protein L486_05778 [Kwoniella mangroviensis CBS 10435]|uniref:FAD-binding domain-containing protein n=1 Tax=Kwoniella mangroviensis CBS 10435 TaxID=1331196 RepID=A0A1B9IMX8_9TREE|nr:uncharacterized protein I203_03053 [Kwoniella mangroviensis CBS 8507]OCF56922.1 hypothetical protein L486_05778 [Kwoniella mangroviensis CBS 10435]OCF67359.1 hypothetical protein I203_03053 [Kwoniella mangroviensis CBS 8507]
MSLSNLKVLVCGASIAGPTTAYWLARAGASVTVIERFPQLRTAGHNVDIRHLGLKVMHQMKGMEEQVLKKKLDLRGISLVNPLNGGTFGVLGGNSNQNEKKYDDGQSLLSEYEIYREISSITPTSPEHDGGGGGDGEMEVGFTNGQLPDGTYDLVVDCGGSMSRTRAIGMGSDFSPKDHLNPVNSWTANFSIPKGPDDNTNTNIALAHSAPGGRVIFLDNTQKERTKVVATKQTTSSKELEDFRQALKAGESQLKRYVYDMFEGSGWRTEEILGGMMNSRSNDFYAGEWLQVKLPRLYSPKGNFVLVGDAGYAPGPTGAGTSLALTGGYILAGELMSAQKEGKGIRAGLEAYNDRMRPIIDGLQKLPPFIKTAMAPQTAWGIWIRNRMFSFIVWSRVLEVMGKYIAPAFESGEKYKLPQCDWKE